MSFGEHFKFSISCVHCKVFWRVSNYLFNIGSFLISAVSAPAPENSPPLFPFLPFPPMFSQRRPTARCFVLPVILAWNARPPGFDDCLCGESWSGEQGTRLMEGAGGCD